MLPPSMLPTRQWLTGSAIVGMLVWLGLFTTWLQQPPDLSATVFLLLLLAILVNTPLALSLLPGNVQAFVAYRWACLLQPVAALSVAATLYVASGGLVIGVWTIPWSALLTAPWLLFAGLLALSALRQLPLVWAMAAWERLRLVAFCFLPIGAAWLLAYCLGLQPLGFRGVIVLLTAIHFHFTGFAATIWASMLGEQLPRSSRSYPWFAGSFVLATPLIAVGITLSPLLEIAGVMMLATSLVGLSVLCYRHVLPTVSIPAKGLLAIAPLAMAMAIALAVIYGIGQYLDRPLLTIPQMVQWHGWLNAVGFTFGGLLGWRLTLRANSPIAQQEFSR